MRGCDWDAGVVEVHREKSHEYESMRCSARAGFSPCHWGKRAQLVGMISKGSGSGGRGANIR
jgi:hypothetical protein